MRTGILAVLLAAVASAGCAGGYKERINQQLWERELRLQEDCIYRLKWELEQTRCALDDANARLAGDGKPSGGASTRSDGPALSVPPGILGPAGSGRGSEAPRVPTPPSGLPEIQPGQEFTPGNPPPAPAGGRTGAAAPPPELRAPGFSPATLLTSANNPLRASERLDPDVEIDRIILNPDLSGGLSPRGKRGDDRLNVTIEQRDSRDRRVLAPGDVSIVVVDPALEGQEARIARWNFDSDEVARHVRRNRDGGSLQFELPWQELPQHSDLRLFVRFTTFDGRRLEANLPIEVQLAETDGIGWKKSVTPLADSMLIDHEDASPGKGLSREAARRPAWSPHR